VVVGPMVAAIGSTCVSGDHSEPSRDSARLQPPTHNKKSRSHVAAAAPETLDADRHPCDEGWVLTSVLFGHNIPLCKSVLQALVLGFPQTRLANLQIWTC